jgi:hypothetical protein
MAIVFARREAKRWQWLKTQEQMPTEDRIYYRRQVVRRFVGCGITIVLAGMLVGLLLFGVTDGLDELNVLGDEAKKRGAELTPEQKDFVRFSLNYVIVLVLVVFAWLVVAFLDLHAIRRFGMRHRKRIRDDRRAMLMRQLPLLRRDREEREQ